MSKDQKPDPKTQQTPGTRLNSELSHRYANALMPAKKKKPGTGPGRGSLTEDLQEIAEPEVETEGQEAAEHEAAELEAEPKKSLFELPRKEPSRPTLLGGGVEIAPSPGPSPSSPTTPVRKRRT